MKRLFLVVFIICTVFYGNAWAGPVLGVKVGLNLANANQDPSEGFSQEIRPGFMFGGSVEFFLSPSNKTTLRLEGLYVQKGWKESGDLVNYEATYSLDELVLAPFLVLCFPSREITPFIQVGPECSVNLSARGKMEINGRSWTADIRDWSSVNCSLNFGGGFAIPSGEGEVVIDARYNLGLIDLFEDEDWSIKTNGIQFLVGYNFTVLS